MVELENCNLNIGTSIKVNQWFFFGVCVAGFYFFLCMNIQFIRLNTNSSKEARLFI